MNGGGGGGQRNDRGACGLYGSVCDEEEEEDLYAARGDSLQCVGVILTVLRVRRRGCVGYGVVDTFYISCCCLFERDARERTHNTYV